MSQYFQVVVETYIGRNTSVSGGIRARPVEGQKINTEMNVECSSHMRKNNPVGTKFLIRAKIINKEGGPDFLYCHYSSNYKILTENEAAEFVRRQNL